jgi:hypothetical protein
MAKPKSIGIQLAAISPFAPLIVYALGGIALVAGIYYVATRLFSQFGAGAADPGGGAASTGVLDGILNQTAEIGRSPLNYTGALQETLLHPVDTIGSITGLWSPAPSVPILRPPSTPDTITYPDYSGVTP